MKTLNDQALNNMAPDLPDLVSFVSRLFYANRNQIMHNLDLTVRAYRFWTLSDRNLLNEAYGGKTPPQIDHAALDSAQITILNAYGQAVENFGTNHSVFSANASANGLGKWTNHSDIRSHRTFCQLAYRNTCEG